MDKFQINEQIGQLQNQLREEIRQENFDKASELQVQINRFKSLKDNYRSNYDVESHTSPMSYDQIQDRINELTVELQGAIYMKDVNSAQSLSTELIKYQEIVRLIDLDKKL